MEGFGKEISHLNGLGLALEVRHNYGNIAAEFPDQLAAGAAGRCKSIGIRDHGNGVEAALPFADGFEDGDAFGAHSEAVSGVLNIASAEDSAGRGTQRGAHAKVRVRRMRVFPRLPGNRNQGIVFAHAIASAILGRTAFSKPMNCPFTRSPVSSPSPRFSA